MAKYTEKQEEEVIRLFNRPLREGEVIVDNTSPTIAKETGFSVLMVNNILNVYLDNKFRLINMKLVNNENN